MKAKNRGTYYKIAVVGLGAAAFALGLLGNVVLCGVFTAASCSIYAARARVKRAAGADAGSYGFVKAVFSSYKKSGSIRNALLDASAAMPDIAGAVRKKLERYNLGDKAAFRPENDGTFTSELSGLIDRALSTGEDAKMELSELAGKLRARMREKIGRAGQAGNAKFVSLLGIIFFFPMFAGISLGILVTSSQIGQGGRLGLSSVALVFAAFIAVECFVHFRWDAGYKAIDRACSAVVCSSLGMLILKASSMLAISAI